jgi:DNA replication protein DnaC
MDDSIAENLNFLGLRHLKETWDTQLQKAQKNSISYHRFLSDILKRECEDKRERRRLARLKNAKIPEMLVMETFPFSRQPKLQKRKVLQVYDSLSFMRENMVLLFAGPTGCGKSGLATSFLVHAINNDYNGLFIGFDQLITTLYQSCADNSQARMIKRLASIHCLLIDEFGYTVIDNQKAGLFFDLIKTRHKKCCTIFTSQLGFDTWETVIKNEHITAAIIDRITENCGVFNMKKCISLRDKHIIYGADD